VPVNVTYSVAISIIFCLGLIVSFSAQVAGTSSLSLSYLDRNYFDVFCGAPIEAKNRKTTPSAVGPLVVNDVTISGFAFSPANLTVNVGETVTWTNQDGTFHSTVSDTNVWASNGLSMGESFSFTFTAEGVFPYHCNPHGFMTASITVVAAPSPTPTPAISGTVTYGNAVSGAPPPRFVSNVLISGAGSPDVSTTTSFPGGTYTLTGFGATSYTVAPTKTDGVNGISSFDAGRIAQHVSGGTLLTGNQLIVADTSNNGSISSFDAAKIAQFVSGGTIIQPNVTGTWRFIPVNRAYASVTSSVAGEDFIAVLMGEVSGNWVNTAPAR